MKHQNNKFKGLEADYDIGLPSYTSAKSSLHEFFNKTILEPITINAIILMIIIVIIVVPSLTFVGFIVGCVFLTIHRVNQIYDILFKVPTYVKSWVPISPIIRKMQKNSDGEIFIGNAIDGTNRELWVSRKSEQKHKLNVSGTGAGKTTAIQGSFISTLGLNGHIVMTEAKGETKIARMTFNCLADFCEEDNAFFTSYATSNRPIEKGYQGTHSTNIMTGNDVNATTEITVGLLAGQEGSNQIFLERATILGKIANLLIYEKEKNSVNEYRITLQEMNKMLNISELIKALNSPWLKSDSIRDQVISYLKSIQVEDCENAKVSKIPPKSLEQHMFAQIFFTKALSTLTENYGHIFNKARGDYIWSNIINRKKHIYQLIPAIDKSDTELGYVAKIDAQLFLNAVKTFLDPRIQGRAHETAVREHADLFTQAIKDEYSFQMDSSQPKLVAQLRSLGVAYSVFIQSLKLSHLINNKVMMAMEKICSNLVVGQTNDEDARKMIITAAGKASVLVHTRLKKINRSSLFKHGYRFTEDAEIVEKNRFDDSDIKTQKEGEVHYVILGEKNSITGCELAMRVRLFYMGEEAINYLENNDDIVLTHFIERTNKIRPKKNIVSFDRIKRKDSSIQEGQEKPKNNTIVENTTLTDEPLQKIKKEQPVDPKPQRAEHRSKDALNKLFARAKNKEQIPDIKPKTNTTKPVINITNIEKEKPSEKDRDLIIDEVFYSYDGYIKSLPPIKYKTYDEAFNEYSAMDNSVNNQDSEHINDEIKIELKNVLFIKNLGGTGESIQTEKLPKSDDVDPDDYI